MPACLRICHCQNQFRLAMPGPALATKLLRARTANFHHVPEYPDTGVYAKSRVHGGHMMSCLFPHTHAPRAGEGAISRTMLFTALGVNSFAAGQLFLLTSGSHTEQLLQAALSPTACLFMLHHVSCIQQGSSISSIFSCSVAIEMCLKKPRCHST